MFKDIIYKAIKNRKITLFASMIILIAGLYSYYMLPRQEAPEINVPVALVTAIYPGASAQEVERDITIVLENAVVEVSGYDYTQSYSMDNICTVVLWLEMDADTGKAWNELRVIVNKIKGSLPDTVDDVMIETNLADTAGIILTLSGEDYSNEELQTYAKELQKSLSEVKGISAVDLEGIIEKYVSVSIDPDKINKLPLSYEDVVNILKADSTEIPSGALGNGSESINVKIPGKYSNVDEINNIMLASIPGSDKPVNLGDIADVGILEKTSSPKVLNNGKDSVLMAVYFKPSKNIVHIGKDISDRIDAFENKLPDGMTVNKALFQPDDIKDAVNGFVKNLLSGILFVVIIVLVSMGVRNALIVSAAIPFSVIASFGVMYLVGVDINQISVAALIISLGMLVDNAIVVSDSIQVMLDSGKDRLESCVEGTKSVAIPVLTSTLTTVAAFLPLLLIPGVAGEYIKSIPLLVIITLIASFIAAVFITPVMSFIFLKRDGGRTKKNIIKSFFKLVLRFFMKRKAVAILSLLIVIAGAAYMATFLKLEFFPKAQKDIIYINVNSELKNNILETENIVRNLNSILLQQEEVINVTSAVGDGIPKFYTTLYTTMQAADFAQLMVKLDLTKTDHFTSNSAFVDYLQGIINDRRFKAKIRVKELEQGEPIGAPIQLRISGDDMQAIKETAVAVEEKIHQIKGVSTIEDDYNGLRDELKVIIDDRLAGYKGITKYNIQNEVNIALSGRTASILRTDDYLYNIVVSSDIGSSEELENIGIKSYSGLQKVLLKEISQVITDKSFSAIRRYDREKTITLMVDIVSGYNSIDVQKNINNSIKDIIPTNVNIVFDGEREKIVKYFGDVGVLAAFAVLLIYIILLLQFRSFRQPLLIMLTVPLSVTGSIAGLLITGLPLSFTSLLGAVSLFGIVVNNAIVLLDNINRSIQKGASTDEACVQSVEMRFRPVMLTTFTTVIGLVPLILSGSGLFMPMAVTLASGLLISTFLTLVAIPTAYYIVLKKRSGHSI